MGNRVVLPGRVESAEVGGIVAGADAIMDDSKGKVQSVINSETDAELLRLESEKQDNITVDTQPVENSGNPISSGAVYAADKALSDAIEAILLLIPSAASVLNKLADVNYVQSAIATATAAFKGTYNLVSDLHLSVSASHSQIAAALDALSLGADANDYCFVQVPTSDQSSEIEKTERYKFNGTSWAYEYDLNNSGFTSDQWAAINSNITALLVSKLIGLPTSEVLASLLASKQDSLTFDNTPTAGSNNPVKSGGIYARNNEIVALIDALDQSKQNNLTFDQLPVNGSTNPVTSGGVYQAVYLVQVALAALDGRVASTEYSVGLLTERVGILNVLYQALSQSDIIVGILPATGVANVIYRVPGTSSFADWMYYNGEWVKLAEYTTLDGYLYKGVATPSSSPAASAVKMFYFASTVGTYTNYGGLVVQSVPSILKYDGANWSQDVINTGEGVFDISVYNAVGGVPRTYSGFDTAVTNANVPPGFRKGGMSVKFIQTSDNKYVQYRLMAQSFTTDTTQWAIADESVYVENPEFIAVWVDSKKNIILAIEKDGNLHFGVGIPRQVIDYIQEKIDELSLDEYEDIVTFLGNLIEGDNTLQELLDKKVDGVYVENPEFIKVCTASEGGILFGIKNNGDVFLGYGVPTQIKEYVETALLGKVNKEEGKTLIPIQYIQEIENPEYIEVVKDENGNLLWAIKKDGTVYFGAGIPKQIEDFMQDYNNTHIIEKELSIDFVIHGFFNKYGKIQGISSSLPDYSISNPVKFYEGDRIKIRCWAVANDPVLIEYQDRWNTYWANTLGNSNVLILPDVTGWGEYECVVKKTSYYVFSCNASDGKQPTIKILRTLTQQSQIDSFEMGERDSYGITDHNYVDEYDFVPDLTKKKTNAILTYSADTKKDSNFIVNAVAYPNGEIIACRAGGNVVKIANDGNETVLLTITNAQDWRGMFMDSQLNVYVSPHSSTFSPGISELDRGLYKLSYGASQFEKVISLCRSTTEIKEWAANTQYAVGDKVMRDNLSDMYICKTAHTSTSSFDATYWNPIDDWTQGTSYAVADLCKYQNRYYRCIENHTSTSSFDVTKWNAATEYMSNDDTIWTMCEDESGFIYAGVYSHSKRTNPAVYRTISAFNNTFYYQHNFIMNGTLPESRYEFNVRHVHCINFNPFDNCLYAAVGEVNTICKSSTHGSTWEDLKVACYYGQPTYVLGVKDGLVIGSDGHYSCGVSKLMSDGKTMKLCGRTAPGFIFNIRRSDLTGWLYAWTRIDNIVQNIDYCPPQEAVDDIDAYNEWVANAPAATLRFWNPYHEWALKYYPDDARRPQNVVIMVSKDEGETWEVFNKVKVGTNKASICGYITVGYFREGECLAGLLKPIDNTESGKAFVEPVVISEGKKKRTSNGYDLTGEIFIKLNTNNTINY